LREATSNKSALKIEKLGYWYTDKSYGEKLLTVLNAVEVGRIVTRDIGGSDPERMAAANVLVYVKKIFESTNNIKVDDSEDNRPICTFLND
jgi:leucyl aminopeptidase